MGVTVHHWLSSIRERRLFYVVLGLLLIVLALIRWVLTQELGLPSILDNLLAAAIVSFVALLFYRIIPREFPKLDFVAQIDPALSNDLHSNAIATSSWWWSSGHYARWARTEVAPEGLPILRTENPGS